MNIEMLSSPNAHGVKVAKAMGHGLVVKPFPGAKIRDMKLQMYSKHRWLVTCLRYHRMGARGTLGF